MENIQHSFNVQITHLACTGTVHAIKSDFKKTHNFERIVTYMDPISHKILKYICTKRESRLMYDILNKVHVTNPTGEKQMGKSFNITDSEWKFIYTLWLQVC